MSKTIPGTECELNDADLDNVSGGFMQLPLAAVKVREIKGGGTGGGEGGQGGQNDPAQMFQQIMQQLTQQG